MTMTDDNKNEQPPFNFNAEPPPLLKPPKNESEDWKLSRAFGLVVIASNWMDNPLVVYPHNIGDRSFRD